MDSKLRCVFEMPSENEKMVSTVVCVSFRTARVSELCQAVSPSFYDIVKFKYNVSTEALSHKCI